MTWAAKEFAGAQLGDARLNHRLIKLTERFADKPTASIPGACPDWSETQGAYRFFDQANNAKRPLKWETVLAPHIELHRSTDATTPRRAVPARHHRAGFQRAKHRRPRALVLRSPTRHV
ncbi:transposase, partial [Verminephrobacter eiseniae]|nr:transposase [Verminephrobacter eiseniae]